MSERLTDAELRALERHCEGRSDVECLALSVREVRALVGEVVERREGERLLAKIFTDDDLILDEEMPDPEVER